MVDAPDAVSAIMNHSKLGSKMNSEALNELFFEEGESKKRRQKEIEDEAMDAPRKEVKREGEAPGGAVSFFSRLL